MVNLSELTKEHYKPKDVAMFFGVTTKTLRNWDEKGKIVFRRDPVSNRRYLTREDVIKMLDERKMLFDDTLNKKRDVIYARVPVERKDSRAALDAQVRFIITKVQDLQNVLVLHELGSGVDEKREKLNHLIKMVLDGTVNRVFVTYPDRLARVGYGYLETVFEAKGVKIEVVKQKDEERYLGKERERDIKAIIESI